MLLTVEMSQWQISLLDTDCAPYRYHWIQPLFKAQNTYNLIHSEYPAIGKDQASCLLEAAYYPTVRAVHLLKMKTVPIYP